MALNGFYFWVIFPILFLSYWLIPSGLGGGKFRSWYLVIVSYLLYMTWKPAFALILLYVTAVTFYGSLSIYSVDNDRKKRRKRLIFILTILCILPLLIFKYYNFINESISFMLGHIGLAFDLPGLNWALPVGISFFTFQALGYMFDVYRGSERPEHNFVDYALFCSFFPQIASGPISTASELLPQIKSEKKFIFENGVQGLKWVLWGIFLKCVVADRLGLYVDTVMSNYTHFSGLNCMWAAILFSIQIYSDFAGYSLMAIGVAKTFGFDLINNFRQPYFAESVTQFWRRWHISLTRWLTKHVYIPLGGSRRSKPRQYTNIMVTFLVSGLWHGANVTFIVWGGIHGVCQSAEKMLGLDPKGRHNSNRWLLKAKPLRIVITFLVVTFAWIFFRMPTIGEACDFISHIFTDHRAQAFMYKASNSDKLFTFLAIFLLFIAELRAEYLRERLGWLNSSWVRWLIYVALFCIILCIGVLDTSSFIYANF